MNEEIWLDITGYEGYYQISNFGRVKSLARTKVNGKNKVAPMKERILADRFDTKGYIKVVLQKNHTKKQVNVHVLVAMMFMGYIQCGWEIVIDHIDNDRTNNHVSNLQITTHRHNVSKDSIGVTGFTGVTPRSGRFAAQITLNYKNSYLGLFDTPEEASEEYQKALAQIEAGTFQFKTRVAKTPFRGVCIRGGKYHARTQHEYKSLFIGSFDSMEEAARARDRKVLELRGPTSPLNFPLSDYITA